MKRFILILLLIFTGQNCFSLEVVYPKSKNVQINSSSTFFIGNSSSNDTLTINGVVVPVVQDGGFAYPVQLKYGENIFILKSQDKTLTYKIKRNKILPSKPQILKEFPETKFIVVKNNATLRNSPVDAGINRLSQLPEGTILLVNGEQGDFYRVKFSNTQNSWIMKTEILQIPQQLPIEIKKLRTKKDKEFIYHRFELSEKIPFSVTDDNNFIKLKFYNHDETFEYPNCYGFDYYYEDSNIFVLKIRQNIPQKPIITIDAGHGGIELGAIGCCGDKEKDINLEIAKYLQQELQKDFNVIMTRCNDSQISLQKRVDISKENNSTALISIHANALPDNQNPLLNRGTSVYYYHNQAKPLAEKILKELTEQTKTNNDGVRQRSLALVRPTYSLSVLVEVAYMINPQDNMMLTNPTFQKQAAKAIADGIRNYFAK